MMKYSQIILSICLSVFMTLLSSCSAKTDIEKEKQSLINADMEFSKYSEKNAQIKSFLAYADENATVMRPNVMPITGKKEIEKLYNTKSDTSFSLTWTPLFAELAGSADLGFTYGTWLVKTKDETGDNMTEEGTYTTIGKKQNDGT